MKKYLNDQLSLGAPAHKQARGHAAKERKDGTKPEPKKSSTKSNKDARGGGTGGNDADDKVKAMTSQKDRVISGLAAQLRSLGATTEFKKDPQSQRQVQRQRFTF